MTVIDSFAGATSASIVAVRGGVIFDVNATQISTNYFEGTNANITGYNTNLKINLKTDVTISGSASLNINSYGVKSLMKVDTAGSTVNLASGDITLNKYNQFIYNGTYFVVMNGTISSGSVISGSGITAISGSGVMSDTTGSVVKHNVSGITSGSYNAVQVDSYGHVISGSIVASSGAISGSGIMSDTAGSVVKHNASAVSPGSYLATNLTVDAYGHVTAAANGTSASSVGAPSDSPFLTTGSTVSLTNYSIITAGSNITITSASACGGQLIIHSTSAGSDYIHVRDEKSSGTAGGTFLSGSWIARAINTEVSDSGSHASISGSQIILAAGTYLCDIICPACQVDHHRGVLYNTSASSAIIYGTNATASTAAAVTTLSNIRGKFILGSQSALEIRHRATTDGGGESFGYASNFGVNEVYTDAQFWKIA